LPTGRTNFCISFTSGTRDIYKRTQLEIKSLASLKSDLYRNFPFTDSFSYLGTKKSDSFLNIQPFGYMLKNEPDPFGSDSSKTNTI
jgi:hypothetical protein